MVMKSFIFWDITPCSTAKVNRCFVETYRLHLQWRRVSQARNQHESGNEQTSVPQERRLTCNGLRRVISQKTEFFFRKRTSQMHFGPYSYAMEAWLLPQMLCTRQRSCRRIYIVFKSDKRRDTTCVKRPTAQRRHTERTDVPVSRFCRLTLTE
jgi:hypothetical protein